MWVAAAIAAVVAAPASGAQGAPAANPVEYQKKAIAVYADARDPIAGRLRAAIADNGRFVWLDAHPAAGQDLPAFTRDIAAARKTAAPTYVLVPRLEFGFISSTSPSVSRSERRGGGYDARAHANLNCPYTLTVDIYDAATARKVGVARDTEVLSRVFEYRYDERTPVEAIQYKAHELARVMAQEAGRPPAMAFASQAADARNGLVNGVLADLKRMPLFRLEVQLSGWSTERDRIVFNLGRAVNVRLDDGFAIVREGRQIGYLKVRSVTETQSEAQPLYISENMVATDRVMETAKAGWNNGLRLGYGYLAGPVATGVLAGEFDLAPAFGGSEHYVTYDVGGITNFVGTGVIADVGYAKKLFWRQWALRLGGKVGFMQLNGLAGLTPLPGGALSTGVDFHFNEHFLWSFDLDLSAYSPIVPKDGAYANQVLYPIGPVGRTGLTILF